MKKKLFKATTLFLVLCTLALSACDSKPVLKDNLEDVLNSTTENNGETADEEKYDGFYGYVANLKERPTEYNGGELTLEYNIINSASPIDIGILVYVNGVLNEYRVDNSEEYVLSYAPYYEEGESKTVKLSFIPYNCKKGETAEVCVLSMLAPSYNLKDASYLGFGNFHKTSTMAIPLEIKINKDTPERDFGGIYTEISKTEITDEFREQYTYEIYDGSSVVEKDSIKNQTNYEMFIDEPLDPYFPCDDTLELTVRAFGQAKKFVAAIYVDHEIVPAFDGKKYALFDVDEGKNISYTTAKIDTSALDDSVHHIYMLAIPVGDSSGTRGQTSSKLLLKDDKLIEQAENTLKKEDENNSNITTEPTEKENQIIDLGMTSMSDISMIDEKTLIIQRAGDIVLYDVKENKVVNTIKNKSDFIEIQIIDNGFALVARDTFVNSLEIYDTEGNPVKYVDVPNQFGNCSNLVVSKDGKHVVYSDYEGVHTDSVDAGDKTQINLVNDTGLEYVLALPYVYDGDDIYCNVFDKENPNAPYFASYNTTTREMTIYCDLNYPKQFSSNIYINSFAISDPTESLTDTSDEIYYMTIGDGKASVLKCEDPRDNVQAYISDNAKYITTKATGTEDPLNNTVKIYDTETGEAIWEITMPKGAISAYVDENTREIYIISEFKIWVYEF